MRGGEKCLEVFCELFPDADLYTLLYYPKRMSKTINGMKVHTAWINGLPAVGRYYRYCLPLFPRAIERFKLSDYDLVLSSSHCVAKGALPQSALHISYIYSPMRYVWDMHDAYFGSDSSWPARLGMSLWRPALQRWDVRSAARVHFFVAISNNIARKIRNVYRRNATVIHPPVDLDRFYVLQSQQPYYLVVSALVPYKRVDLTVEAFNELKLPLRIVGEGPLKSALQKRARANIEFLGWVGDEALAALYASCQALVLPGEEDFGIVPLEAHASGRPVIAYGRGGALETVIPLAEGADIAPTGIFFPQLTAQSLITAVESFEKNKHRFDPKAMRSRASLFSRPRFKSEIHDFVEQRLMEWKAAGARVA
jgi:glycosyltransferase involved in cell wall biosynthesis